MKTERHYGAYPTEEPESYLSYKKRIIESAEHKLFMAVGNIKNSSLKPDDKKQFKENVAKLLIDI